MIVLKRLCSLMVFLCLFFSLIAACKTNSAKVTEVVPEAPLRSAASPVSQSDNSSFVASKMQPGMPLILADRNGLASFRDNLPQELGYSMQILKSAAEKAFKEDPPSVTAKTSLPASADPHDYVSFSIYYWPDPAKKDGKPYIFKDGHVNPEYEDSTKYDSIRMNHMITMVDQLSYAYTLTGDQSYAEAAAKLLKVWFLNDDTNMNPNMKFGQEIPGKANGSPSGIIEGRRFISVIDSVHMIEGSDAWTEADDQGMKKWFHEYVTWLRTSEFGKRAERSNNNNGVWYDAITAASAWFSGDVDLARTIVEAAKTNRIDKQIKPDGTMPRELERNKSLQSTVSNLEAFITLSRIGDMVGVNLWDYTSGSGQNLKNAVHFVLPSILGQKKWEYKDIGGANLGPGFARYVSMWALHDSDVDMNEVKDRLLQSKYGIELISTMSFMK
ncbi:alginate lyase family protein [Paenibacillus soyae]|uniref:Alginate lyase family protein n=1 Tax=Paenibacillus soyae TaxID=2969249 RepID=A0A9X2MVT2_9BACL|nr:alginate lyase family protein [Paenibacillus soyae]MCR2807390.1 alginate lyase family protein [Paenibacillus soyae]